MKDIGQKRKYIYCFLIEIVFTVAIFAVLPFFGIFAHKAIAQAETAPPLITSRAELIAAVNNAQSGNVLLVGNIDFKLSGSFQISERITLSKSITIKNGLSGSRALFSGGSFVIDGAIDSESEKLTVKFENIIFDGETDISGLTSDDWNNDDTNHYEEMPVKGRVAVIFQGNADVSFANCSFTHYMNINGGAFYGEYGFDQDSPNNPDYRFCSLSVALYDCEFSGNSAKYGGGAIYLRGYRKNISISAYNCRFIDNICWGSHPDGGDSVGGGAIMAQDISLYLTDCYIADNDASYTNGSDTVRERDSSAGGGILCTYSELKIRTCVIAKNIAGSGGGLKGLYNTLTEIEACVIADNTAIPRDTVNRDGLEWSAPGGIGGALYIETDVFSPATLVNTSIYSNYALTAYGGLYVAYDEWMPPEEGYGTVASVFCTYAFNTADGIGIGSNEADMYYSVWDVPFVENYCSIVAETDIGRSELPTADNGYNCYSDLTDMFFPELPSNGNYEHLIYSGDSDGFIVPESALQDLQLTSLANVCGTLYTGSNACFVSAVTLYSDGAFIEETTFKYGGVLPDVSRTGYTFAGWTLADGKTVNPGNLLVSGHLEHLELYAAWLANTYTATFVIDGKLLEIAQVYDAEWDLPDTKKDGYTFAGWYSDEGGSGERMEVGTVYKIDGDITLYAHYNKNFPVLAVVLSVTGVLILGLAAAYVITRKRKAPLPQAVGETSFGLPLAVNGNLDRLTEKYNLTAREKEITSLLASGKPPMAIAEELFISVETVKKHIKNIYEKLDIHRKYELLEKLRNS